MYDVCSDCDSVLWPRVGRFLWADVLRRGDLGCDIGVVTKFTLAIVIVVVVLLQDFIFALTLYRIQLI